MAKTERRIRRVKTHKRGLSAHGPLGGNGARGPGGNGHLPGPSGGSGDGSLPAAKTGLWLFLAAATILFTGLLSAYLVRMDLPGWRSIPLPATLWFNTAALVVASAAVQWAWVAARQDDLVRMRRALWFTGAAASVFVAGQLRAWSQLQEAGLFVNSTPASSFFYLVTALHGLHVLSALVFWAVVMQGARRPVLTARLRLYVELCALFWHFLLGVWLVFFALMSLT